jgi:hypothetical protein
MFSKFYFFLFFSCSLKNIDNKMQNDPIVSLDHFENFKYTKNKSNQKKIREEIFFVRKKFFEEKSIDEKEFGISEKVCCKCEKGVFGEDFYCAFYDENKKNFSCKECCNGSSNLIKFYCFVHYDSPNEFGEELENNYAREKKPFDDLQKVRVSIAYLITFLSWSKKREINCPESEKEYLNFCIKEITIKLYDKFIKNEKYCEPSPYTPINKLKYKKYIPVVHDQLYKILEKICKKNHLTLYYISNLSPKNLLAFLKYIQIKKEKEIEKMSELDEKSFEEKYSNTNYLEKYKKKYLEKCESILDKMLLPYEFYLEKNEKK